MRVAMATAVAVLAMLAGVATAQSDAAAAPGHNNHHFSTPVNVWSQDEMKQCGGVFGVPNLVTTPDGIFIFGRCCAYDACVNKDGDDMVAAGGSSGRLGDPETGAYTVMKKALPTLDGWDDSTYRVVTKQYGEQGYVGATLYDFVRHRLFVLSRSYNPKDLNDINYYSMWSTDEGKSWTTVDVTDQIRPLAPEKGKYMSISAGTKTIIRGGPDNGRIVINMRTGGLARLVYSDDGGHTWNASNVYLANENSVTQCPIGQTKNQNNQTLYIVGRPQPGWASKDLESQYWSYDGGHHVTPHQGEASQLPSVPDKHGCERSIVNAGNGIISCEPDGENRTNMKCYCSRDCGHTWPYSVGLTGPGGYSDLTTVPGGGVLLAYQAPKAHPGQPANFLSVVLHGGWCHDH